MIQFSLIASFMHKESLLIINHVKEKGHPLSKCNPQLSRIRQICKEKNILIFNKDFFQTSTLKMFFKTFIKSYVMTPRVKYVVNLCLI